MQALEGAASARHGELPCHQGTGKPAWRVLSGPPSSNLMEILMPELTLTHGHAFNADNVCEQCGMSRREYDDRAHPHCTAVKPEGIALPVDDLA